MQKNEAEKTLADLGEWLRQISDQSQSDQPWRESLIRIIGEQSRKYHVLNRSIQK